MLVNENENKDNSTILLFEHYINVNQDSSILTLKREACRAFWIYQFTCWDVMKYYATRYIVTNLDK